MNLSQLAPETGAIKRPANGRAIKYTSISFYVLCELARLMWMWCVAVARRAVRRGQKERLLIAMISQCLDLFSLAFTTYVTFSENVLRK